MESRQGAFKKVSEQGRGRLVPAKRRVPDKTRGRGRPVCVYRGGSARASRAVFGALAEHSVRSAIKVTEKTALMQNLLLNFTRCPGLSATLFTKGPDSSLSLLTSVDAIAGISSLVVMVVNPL